jgi:hypothetical protein
MTFRGKVNTAIKTPTKFIIKDAKTGIVRKYIHYYRYFATNEVYARTYTSMEISMGEVTYFIKATDIEDDSMRPPDPFRFFRQQVNEQGEVTHYMDNLSNEWKKEWGIPNPFLLFREKYHCRLLHMNISALNKKYRTYARSKNT